MRKFTVSTRYLLTFSIILAFTAIVFPQSEKYSAAAKWGFYAVTEDKVSFMLPRLPVLIGGGDSCRGESTRDYYAYTNGAVYSVRITSKVKPSRVCRDKKKFDEKNFSERLNELKKGLTVETDLTKVSADSQIELAGENKVFKLINDYENKRWFELSVFGADEKGIDAKNFLNSLKIENPVTGIPIGQGALQVFGDDPSGSIVEEQITDDEGVSRTIKRMLIKIESKEPRGVMIATKPRANYTDAARQMQTQGKVVLRVTFQANGGIGEVSIISGLGAGLTEEAIRAARKIAFIPAQRNGARYSVTKPVEYTFTIY